MTTLADYGPAIRTLLDFVDSFPGLPEAPILLTPNARSGEPAELAIHVHNDGNAFVQWRAALGLRQPTSDLRVFSNFQTMQVSDTRCLDTPVELIAFLPLPLHDVPGDGSGADENARAAASAA